MMEKYRIEIKQSAIKELKNIPSQDLKKVMQIVQKLCINPRPSGCKKLSADNKYRLRYRFYRILYSIEDNILTIYIIKVGHRKSIYR